MMLVENELAGASLGESLGRQLLTKAMGSPGG